MTLSYRGPCGCRRPPGAASPSRCTTRARKEPSATGRSRARSRPVRWMPRGRRLRIRDGGYELVAGERRLRAARIAGLATIPAVIRNTDDAEGLREALIENLHREDLGPIELAEAFQELLDDLGATQEQLAERLGFSRPHIANTLRLLNLPPEAQRLVGERKLSAVHARALLGLT